MSPHILAEIVAMLTLLSGRKTLHHGETTKFRNDLGHREPILAIIHDAHDSHKHGELVRWEKKKAPKGASKGQRPDSATRAGFFSGHTFVGGLLTTYDVLVLKLNDGTELEIYDVLYRAREAWDHELQRLNL
jgi:hypothetical protein